jgi:glycosyltransferase involved in cell wall biosynthesis
MANNWGKGSVPLVSVCCTAYNIENFIARTLDSILDQKTDFPFEIILHDDASTDRTPEIITSYADKYPEIIKPIFQETNIYTSHEGRIAHIFNHYMLPLTRGEFIATSDGDDYWTDTGKLQKQVNLLKETPGCVACFTNARIINELVSGKSREYHNDQNEGFVPELTIALRGGGLFSNSTLVFRKKDFLASQLYNHYDELARYLENDTLYIYTLMFAGKVSYLKDVTAIYRQWEGGLFSGIMYDAEKSARLMENEMKGTEIIIGLADKNRRNLFRRGLKVINHMQRLRHYKAVKRIVGYVGGFTEVANNGRSRVAFVNVKNITLADFFTAVRPGVFIIAHFQYPAVNMIRFTLKKRFDIVAVHRSAPVITGFLAEWGCSVKVPQRHTSDRGHITVF